MTPAQYRKLRHADLRAAPRRGRLLRDVSTFSVTLPAGMGVEITGKYSGLDIKGAACEHCGVTAYCRRLDPLAVELLDT